VKKKHNNTKVKTTVLMVMFVSVLLFSTLAGVGKVSAAIMWSKTYGGAKAEGHSGTGTGANIYPVVIQTSDGGFLLTGDTSSYGAGSNDAYLVKTDANGEMQWNKTYGGSLNESACLVWPTSDGGYALACITNSYGAGDYDAWLLKIDANGNMLWNKTYGGTGDDSGYIAIQTADGGYILCAMTNSFGAGNYDNWLIKTDSFGNMLWNKTYGGTGIDIPGGLILTADGGYAIVSFSGSFGGFKGWLIKTDSSGNMLWNKTYGIGAASLTYSGIQMADGGYTLVGATYLAGKTDAWLIRTDSFGNMLWNKTYGGTGDDAGWLSMQMDDGGYLIIGVTSSFGAGGQDGWLFRTDATGNMLWNKTYGGAGTEFVDQILQTSDGGYIMAGYTDSFGAGSTDLWLIKTDELGVVPEGLTIGVMMLLSAVVVIVGTRYFRKRPKTQNYSQVKP